MAKVTSRNRQRVEIQLQNEKEVGMMLYILRIAEQSVKDDLETFIFSLWDQLKTLPQAKNTLNQIGDM